MNKRNKNKTKNTIYTVYMLPFIKINVPKFSKKQK